MYVIPRNKKLFAPGPIKVPEVIKKTFLEDPPYFASEDFSDLIRGIQPGLRTLFKSGNYPVLIGCGSGSLGLQCAITNFFKDHERVLVIGMGKYGALWKRMCLASRLYVHDEKENIASCGSYISPEDVARSLRSLPAYFNRISGVFITHTETTTATVAPLEEYIKVIRENSDALIVVDAVASLLTEPLESFRCDVVLSASQKALSLPPGMFFMMVSDRALMRAMELQPTRDVYFHVPTEIARYREGITMFTPAASLFPALKVALDLILEAGVDNIVELASQIAAEVRHHLRNSYELVSDLPSNAVTALWTHDKGKAREWLNERGFVVGDGVGNEVGKLIRIMHFGWNLDHDNLYSLCDLLLSLAEENPVIYQR